MQFKNDLLRALLSVNIGVDSVGADWARAPNNWETPMHLSLFTTFSQYFGLPTQYFWQVYASVSKCFNNHANTSSRRWLSIDRITRELSRKWDIVLRFISFNLKFFIQRHLPSIQFFQTSIHTSFCECWDVHRNGALYLTPSDCSKAFDA